MMKYDDGTPASTPQMAHDVSTFLDFLENHNLPDIKLTIYMYFIFLLIRKSLIKIYKQFFELNL